MREVREEKYDDLIFAQTGEKVVATEEREFEVDGAPLFLDLTEDNAALFDQTMKPFVDAAQERSPRRKSGGSGSAGTTKKGSSKKASASEREENDRIREWARSSGWAEANNFTVSDRGRIPGAMRDAYYAQQTGQPAGQVSQDTLTDEAPPEPGNVALTSDPGAQPANQTV